MLGANRGVALLGCPPDARGEAAEHREVRDLWTQPLLHPLRGHSRGEVSIEDSRAIAPVASRGRRGCFALGMSVEYPSSWLTSGRLIMRHLPKCMLGSSSRLVIDFAEGPIPDEH